MSNFRLYDFQKNVSKELLAGNSVILQAPTGSGKTIAALLPFIDSWKYPESHHFPSKCVYVVPMRVLANQFVKEYKKLAENYRMANHRKLSVAIQTGEFSEDKKFESDLIFCTIDQFLSSYLMMPYSLGGRQANLNAGAFVGRYFVFDEFHLLDPASTLPTTLFAIKRLQKIAPILLMTATFSATMLNELAKMINAKPYLVSPEENQKINQTYNQSHQRARIWNTCESPIHDNIEFILDLHQNRSLVICNTVKNAQNIYQKLKAVIDEKGLQIEVVLLHSRFLNEDRQKKENKILSTFGKHAQKNESTIVVATQTIEVGVDITCEALHTELAPASSLIQRAGRCARYPGEIGQVYVYPVEKYSPYGKESQNGQSDPLWVKQMKNAYSWLKQNTGCDMGFGKEQEFVNSVATPQDRILFNDLQAGWSSYQDKIHTVLAGGDLDRAAQTLVRDANSRTVLIHPTPDELLSNPYAAQGFNIDFRTLLGMVAEWKTRSSELDLDWVVKFLIIDTSDDHFVTYGWQDVTSISQIAGSPIVVVHPELAGYTGEEGFLPDKGQTQFVSELISTTTRPTGEPISYRLESYQEHIRLVLATFQEFQLPEILYAARALENAAGWEPQSVLLAAWLACLFHDVGKLNKDWQQWVHIYQKAINQPIPQKFAAAHTFFQIENPVHKESQKITNRKVKKPPHSAEGALAITPVIANALKNSDLTSAVITAICRHHAPFATSCQEFELTLEANSHIAETLLYIPPTIRERIDLNKMLMRDSSPVGISELLTKPHDVYGWLAYTLIVRALRNADQYGTKRGSQ